MYESRNIKLIRDVHATSRRPACLLQEATHTVDVFKMTSKQSLEKNGLVFVHVQDVEYLFRNNR
jgi:hypothetical protein